MRGICHRSAGSVEGLVLGEPPTPFSSGALHVWAAQKCSNGVKDRHARRPRGSAAVIIISKESWRKKKKKSRNMLAQWKGGLLLATLLCTQQQRCLSDEFKVAPRGGKVSALLIQLSLTAQLFFFPSGPFFPFFSCPACVIDTKYFRHVFERWERSALDHMALC